MPRKPVDRPKYLLDTQEWKVRLYDVCWDLRDGDLKKNGFGAISYSWGRWKDRRHNKTAAPGEVTSGGQYPTFDVQGENGVALYWNFPIVRKAPNSEEEQFTIDDVKEVFNRMGMRFVWWDWACIPQGTGLSIELQNDQAKEMNKMRYVYPNSSRGSIWVHNSVWNQKSAMEDSIEVCTQYLAALPNRKTLPDVTAVLTALESVNVEEVWFTSLWCFQEGVLFSHPNRPANGGSSVFRDHSGRPSQVMSERLEGDLMDLVTVASGIGGTIINCIRNRVEGNALLPDAINTFANWCLDGGNEAEARKLMDRFVRTGMVFYNSQGPLSLLNARFNRTWNQWTELADVEVNTIIGALEVDITRYLRPPPPETLTNSERETYLAAKLAAEREGMLIELFKTYQWRMLLFAVVAKGREKPAKDLMPIWPSLVRIGDFPQKQPQPFTSIDYFAITAHLFDRFKPPPPRYEGEDPPVPKGRPSDQFDLPILEYITAEERQYLILHKLAGFRVFDLKVRVKPWAKCMFYEAPGKDEGQYIPRFSFVEFQNWQTAFGEDVLMIPIENLRADGGGDEWAKNPRLRCAVLKCFGLVQTLQYPEKTPTPKAGIFVGIADVESMTAAEGNLELTEDITIY